MTKTFLTAAFAILIFSSIAFAQDPGMPDSVIIGNLDGSPIYTDSSANVDVWIKNDENKETCYFLIGMERGIGRLDRPLYFEPLTSWDIIIDSSGIDLPDYPNFTFFRTACYCRSDPGCSNPLNTDSTWQRIMTVQASFYPDSLIPGDTSCMIAIWQSISSVQAGCFIVGPQTEIKDDNIPNTFETMQIYPNPFNAQTTIEYSLSKSSPVEINIYDIAGRKIEALPIGFESAGRHSIIWNASKESSGIYFCKIKSRGYSMTQRMVLLK